MSHSTGAELSKKKYRYNRVLNKIHLVKHAGSTKNDGCGQVGLSSLFKGMSIKVKDVDSEDICIRKVKFSIIYLPKVWIGKRVEVSVVDDGNDKDI